MNTTNRPLRARTSVPRALARALQWRLLLVWMAATLLCALLATLPVWTWLAGQLNHALQAPAIAAGQAPLRLIEAMMADDAPMAVLFESVSTSAILMLLLSPLLAGATVAAARSRTPLGFGDLLRGGIGEYGPMLRLLLWSVIPLGAAAAIAMVGIGANEKIHEQAILAADIERGRNIALAVGGVLLLLAHAGIEAGRGWLAADARLRSAFKAWWRGVKLLCRRPLAVLSAYLVPTLCSLLLALLVVALRQRIDASGFGGFLLALLLGCSIAGALAWGKIARLFALRALAEDAHARR